jgi:hypothetical protein
METITIGGKTIIITNDKSGEMGATINASFKTVGNCSHPHYIDGYTIVDNKKNK